MCGRAIHRHAGTSAATRKTAPKLRSHATDSCLADNLRRESSHVMVGNTRAPISQPVPAERAMIGRLSDGQASDVRQKQRMAPIRPPASPPIQAAWTNVCLRMAALSVGCSKLFSASQGLPALLPPSIRWVSQASDVALYQTTFRRERACFLLPQLTYSVGALH
jgi:hypothetical protein